MEGSRLVPGYPNRHRPESKATRSAVILLLIVSAILTLIIAVAGIPVAASGGMQFLTFVFVVLYIVMVWYIIKWSRGVLAMAAAFAVLFALVAIVAAPGWFARDQAGFIEPLLPAQVLGLLTIILVPVQLLLVAFAMRGFNQAWHIEVQVPAEQANDPSLADEFDEGGRRVQHEDEEEEAEEVERQS
jgi:hypothetical protein